jgi:hypothetical protein
VASTGEKRLNLIGESIAGMARKVFAGYLDETGTPDVVGQPATVLDGDSLVVGSVQHERRHRDGRQHRTYVDVHECVEHGPNAVRAPHSPFDATPPLAQARVRAQLRRPRSQRLPGAPAVVEDAIQVRDVRVHVVRVVDVAADPRRRAVQDERDGPLRVGRREQDAHRPALGHPEQHCSFGAHRVHDGTDVVHPLLECRCADVAVRQTHPPLVEDHQA